jgi:hypothetical protein
VELVYIICKTAPEKENGVHQFPRSRPVTGASGLHACRSASALEWQKVRFRQLLRHLPCLLFHAGLIPAMPGSAMQDFRIFHTMPGTWIAPAAMTGNTIVVAWSILSQDSWPSLMSCRRQKPENGFRPSQKNRQAWSWLDLL